MHSGKGDNYWVDHPLSEELFITHESDQILNIITWIVGEDIG